MRYLLVLIVLIMACSGGAESTPTTTTGAITTTTAVIAPSPTSTAAATTTTAERVPQADLRFVDYGAQPSLVDITVTVERGDLSVLLYARSTGFSDFVAVIEVIEPDGASVTDVTQDAFVDAFINSGEIAFVVPFSPELPIQPGDYVITLATDGDGFETVEAVFRSGAITGDQLLDVVFWDASTDPATDGVALENVVATILDTADVIFAGNRLGIGEVSIRSAPQDLVERYATLTVDEESFDQSHRELCRALGSSERALQVVLVDFISDGSEDGIVEGTAAGIPGAVLVNGAATGCVAVAVSPDPLEPERGIFERSTVIWHEVGHLLGLFHTSEADATFFDLIADTPQCTVDRDTDGDGFVDEFECEDADGENLMFHDSDGLTLTEGQVSLLRRHPLLHN